MPVKTFNGLLQARRWVTPLVHWYNHEHCHSAISFVTPAQRYIQVDQALMDDRTKVYATARDANLNRWSVSTRNWSRFTQVNSTRRQKRPTINQYN